MLAVSPHLDDAAFSVGGTLARLVDRGAEVTVLTCFTASVPDPTGFALACQTDKGLAPDVDYMAWRREEDRRATAVLGAAYEHLPLPEAPHRGYDSAAALFAGVRPDDDVHVELRRLLAQRVAEHRVDLVLAPQALGGHVDHLQVLRAVASLDVPTGWWRDVPYLLRDPDAQPGPDLPAGLQPLSLPTDEDRRARACACYVTQLGFQFGGPEQLADALAGLPEPLLVSSDSDRPLRAAAARAAHRGRAAPGQW